MVLARYETNHNIYRKYNAADLSSLGLGLRLPKVSPRPFIFWSGPGCDVAKLGQNSSLAVAFDAVAHLLDAVLSAHVFLSSGGLSRRTNR